MAKCTFEWVKVIYLKFINKIISIQLLCWCIFCGHTINTVSSPDVILSFKLSVLTVAFHSENAEFRFQ